MSLTINNFHKGQSSSPYLTDGAFSKSQNLDVFSQPGIARINYLPTAGTGTVSDLPLTFTRSSGSATSFFAVDDNNNTYLIDPTTNPHSITAQGSVTGKTIIHWKEFLLGINGQTLRYHSSGTTWVNWDGTPTVSHSVGNMFMLDSVNDGKLYILSGNDVDTVVEDTNFNPATAATFTVTKGAFTLPEGYWGLGLAEIGIYIIIAAVKTTSAFSSTLKRPVTTYFFWDRSEPTADRIIELPELKMTNLFSIGNDVFLSGGDKGRIYKLTESGFELYAQIPFDYSGAKTVQIGGLNAPSMAWWQGMLLVGVSSTDGLAPAGIYGIKDGKIAHLFLPNEGLDGSTKDILIGGIYPYDESTLYFGWENDTDNTYEIDEVLASANRVGSYGSYFESIFIPVATRGSKKSFDKVEVQLARPLQIGEGVRIKWRKNINDSWTTLGTQDFSTNGAVSSLEFPGIHNLENIQIRVELTTGATANTPYILEIRLLP